MEKPKAKSDVFEPDYEYCPRCYANLTLQKGYRNDLPYWVCTGCGEMLINPEVEGDIAWICDGCGEMLNIQPGFHEDCGVWACTKCGFENKIDPIEMYASEDEYQAAARSPYKGLSDEDMLALSCYQEEGPIGSRDNILIVRYRESGEKYVKKLLTTYDRSVYEYLHDHPVAHMPVILELFEGDNALIVIEEYVEGNTLETLLEHGLFPEDITLRIIRNICLILHTLHTLPTPIIHRDVKPSNIIITPDNEVVLLDMNAAKWYDPDQADDTRHMGTQVYAAPEQAGYGLSASSAKSDIYAVGILLNVMLTEHFPKEQRVDGPLWEIIERCISLNAGDRHTAAELIEKLDHIGRSM